MNTRLTKKDRALIKGALRRAFSRSELHNRVIAASIIQHSDPKRKQVKTWCRCNVCKEPEAKSYMAVDHIDPLVPVDTTYDDLCLKIGLDGVVDRLWCEENNLQSICPECHDEKTAIEKDARKAYKKGKKNGKAKT